MERAISQDGTPIAFDRLGDGPAVIIVVGALADRSAGAPLAALLAPHFTVFTYDRRGRGDSGDTAPYAVKCEVEDLEALIREAGGSACVFGGSSGAALALDAANRGRAITKLALYEPPFIVDESSPPLPKNYATQLAELIAAGRRSDALERYMNEALGVPAERLTQMRTAPFWPAMEAVAHTLVYDFTILGDTMTGTRLPIQKWASVTVPTLVMDGGASAAVFHSAAQALTDILPNAQRRTLTGQDHAVDPQILAPLLEEFFGQSNERYARTHWGEIYCGR